MEKKRRMAQDKLSGGIPVFRLRFNQDTGQWEQHPLDGFFALKPETMAELYKKSQANMELLREAFIEQALEKSDWHESQEVIDWIKNK